jgi:hypothetical protein
MWTQPWRYKEGTAIAVGLLVTGELLQLTVGPVEWKIFMWPANAIVLAVFLLFLAVAYLLRSRVYACRFMTTSYAAVPALAAAALMTVLMGLTRQVAEGSPPADPVGLTRMLSYWPFVLIYVWMTAIVAQAAIHQLAHFSWRRLPALVSHVGIFIALTAATLGSADMQRLKMYCMEGQPEWRALDERQQVHELPIAIQLNQFTIDEYPPKLMMTDGKGLPLPHGKPASLTADSSFRSGTLQGWTIRLLRRIENAAPATLGSMAGKMPPQMMRMMRMDSLGLARNSNGFTEWKQPGAACALYVEASKGKEKRAGWVSCGSYMFGMQTLKLDATHTLVMPNREPKRFASDIEIYTRNGQNVATVVEVNKPYSIAGWKIYQLSYNEQMGKWSNLSIFELVTDPWLPLVYAGIFLLLAGALLMLFFPHTSNNK